MTPTEAANQMFGLGRKLTQADQDLAAYVARVRTTGRRSECWRCDKPMSAAADRLTATLNAFADDMVRAVVAAGRVWGESMEASAARWRVARMMPTLTMRGVLVHGHTAFEEA